MSSNTQPEQGVEPWLSSNAAELLGWSYCTAAVATDLDKVMCPQGLFKSHFKLQKVALLCPQLMFLAALSLLVVPAQLAQPAAPPWAVEGNPIRFYSPRTPSGVAGAKGAAACWVPLVTCQSPSRPSSLTCFQPEGALPGSTSSTKASFLLSLVRIFFFFNSPLTKISVCVLGLTWLWPDKVLQPQIE